MANGVVYIDVASGGVLVQQTLAAPLVAVVRLPTGSTEARRPSGSRPHVPHTWTIVTGRILRAESLSLASWLRPPSAGSRSRSQRRLQCGQDDTRAKAPIGRHLRQRWAARSRKFQSWQRERRLRAPLWANALGRFLRSVDDRYGVCDCLKAMGSGAAVQSGRSGGHGVVVAWSVRLSSWSREAPCGYPRKCWAC